MKKPETQLLEAPSAPPSGAGPRALRSRRVVTPEGEIDGAVIFEGGRILEVTRNTDDLPAAVEDVGDLAVLPGGVDSHVHLNEPGRAEWEGLETGTRAARAGGLTTLVDMPLNSSPVTTTVASLEAKREAAREHARGGRLHADLAFYGGLVPGNLEHLEPLLGAGVAGLKVFLSPSGLDDFPASGEAELRPAMEILARRGGTLLAHAELVSELPDPGSRDPNRYATWLASRPSRFETDAHELLLRLVRETGCRLHIVHLATADALETLAAARAEGLPVTVETCPHYLTFTAEEIPGGEPSFKCAPPIRSARHREALWQALADGVIDLVASDHSPAPPSLKTGDLVSAWGGIASLEVSLAATWTEARRRGHGLPDLARWMALEPAKLAGLDPRKGALAPGLDADFLVFDPDHPWKVQGERLHHRHPQTAYEGRQMSGRVVRTYLRGAAALSEMKVAPNSYP